MPGLRKFLSGRQITGRDPEVNQGTRAVLKGGPAASVSRKPNPERPASSALAPSNTTQPASASSLHQSRSSPCQRMARAQAAAEHHRFEQTVVRAGWQSAGPRRAQTKGRPEQQAAQQPESAAAPRTLARRTNIRGEANRRSRSQANVHKPQPAQQPGLVRCRAQGTGENRSGIEVRGRSRVRPAAPGPAPSSARPPAPHGPPAWGCGL